MLCFVCPVVARYFPIGAPPAARYTQSLITLTDLDMEQDDD
ncbi:hypothetical protein [Roseobacter sp. CCS2]|nr:hypothetical protein [Roseobacter sp. CCS2]EBA10961.1 hypothetical protein RCCS2_00729 [Roseobacter sp. CCS2]